MRLALALLLILVLAACGGDAVSPAALGSGGASMAVDPSSPAPASAAEVEVVAAPGSDSSVYPPHPSSIVVAIDAGHGGCLDWGVPDPSQRGVAFAEKTMTMAIADELRRMLEAEGISVVMTRDGDVALAGDDYADLDCHGGEWRDVNGDEIAGFGPDVPEATRTRDELQARLDLANIVAADVLVSIHINSPFHGGQTIETAFSETFYTDETPWGATATARLAELIQAGVVAELEEAAAYERGDRGTTAHNFYMVAPPLFEPTPERPDPVKQPTRGGLMPTVLSEVGSITLRAEHDLLVSTVGQQAVAHGLFDGIASYFADRPLAARIALAGSPPGLAPDTRPGSGPPFWLPSLAAEALGEPVPIGLVNTGTDGWPAGLRLVAGWSPSAEPYLAAAPERLVALDVEVPALAPGESVELHVTLPQPPTTARQVAWITLADGPSTLADLGSPPLQLATTGD